MAGWSQNPSGARIRPTPPLASILPTTDRGHSGFVLVRTHSPPDGMHIGKLARASLLPNQFLTLHDRDVVAHGVEHPIHRVIPAHRRQPSLRVRCARQPDQQRPTVAPRRDHRRSQLDHLRSRALRDSIGLSRDGILDSDHAHYSRVASGGDVTWPDLRFSRDLNYSGV